MKIKAVFFDAGGTLFRPYPSVGDIYAKAAKCYGTECDPKILEAAFYAAWKNRGGLASLGEETSEAKEKAWWRSLVTEVFQSHGRSVGKFDDFFEELHRSFEEKHLWEIFPETIDVLTELKKQKRILGVVSNWDLRLQKVLANLDLERYFDFWVSSSMCGATKPNAKIFLEALRRAKVKAEEALHVGDTYDEDIIGAEAVGIRAVLVDRSGDHSIPSRVKIKSLREILDYV